MIFKQTTYEQDYEIVVDLCAKWWPDSLFFKTYGIEYKVHKTMFDAANESGILVYTIGYIDDEPAGCYIGVKQPYMFNPEYNLLTEIVWCLDEKYRGFKNLMELLGEVERLGSENDCQLYSLAVSSASEYDGLQKILDAKGFVNMDHVFMKKLGGENAQ